MSVTESTLQRQLTQFFIDDNPTSLVLTRSGVVPDGEGGWTKQPPTDLAPQVVRLVVSRLVSGAGERTTEDGRQVTVDYTVVGLEDLDVQEGDAFSFNGRRYRVQLVKRIQDWSVEADATQRGA